MNNYDIPPLRQTLKEVENEYNNGTILKALVENIIVGSVRGYIENSVLYIGKLFVHPCMQGKGIGTKLLLEIESIYPHNHCELFTSSKSEKNLQLYKKVGYSIFKKQEITPELTLLFLKK